MRHVALVAALAILLRLVVAYVVLPPSLGFGADLELFRMWAADLGANGPFGAYERGYRLDYLPGYLWILWLLGSICAQIVGTSDPGALVKLPAIVADGVLVIACVRLAKVLGATVRAQWLLAAVLAVGPMIWIDSVVWGQVDSVGACLLVFGVTALIKRQNFTAAAFSAVAAMIKPQFGILIPIVVFIALLRTLRSRNPRIIFGVPLAGVAMVSVMALPFGLTALDVIKQVMKMAGQYPVLSANAWNVWALIEFNGSGLSADRMWIPDDLGLLGSGPSMYFVGTALLAAATGFALWLSRSDEDCNVACALALLSIAFFVLPTRVHERYLFSAIPLTLVLAAIQPRWWIVASLVSFVFTANVTSILTAHFLEDINQYDLGSLKSIFQSPLLLSMISFLQSSIAVVISAFLVLSSMFIAGLLGLQQNLGKNRQ